MAFVTEKNLLAKSKAAGALDAVGDTDDGLDTAVRITTDRGFSRKHQAVRFFIRGVHHVGHFGAGRRGIHDHRLQKLGRHDHAFSKLMAASDDAALEDRQFFKLDLDPEIAACDHDHVSGEDDGVDVADGLLVLDLGDDLGVTFQRLDRIAKLTDMRTVADE